MGILSNALNRIKETYNRIDTRVGGYLPGGQTPSQVSAPSGAGSMIFKESESSSAQQAAAQGYNTQIATSGGSSKSSSVEEALAQQAGGYISPVVDQGFGKTYQLPSGKIINAPEGYSAGINNKGDLVYKPDVAPTILQRVKNMVLGDQLGGNPLTGEIYLDKLTGEKPKSVSNVVPLDMSPVGGAGTVSKLGLLGNVDDAALAIKSSNSMAKVSTMVSNGEKIANAIANGEDVIDGVTAAAAAGKTVNSVNGVAQNTFTNALTLKAIYKSVSKYSKTGMWVVGAIAGWISTGAFAANEHRDAEASLQFAITDASKAGEWDTVDRLKDYYDDIKMDKLYKYLGPLGYLMASNKKATAAEKIIEEAYERSLEEREQEAKDEALLNKINAGTASDMEIQDYIDRNPYSLFAKLYTQQALEDVKSRGTYERAQYYDNTRAQETSYQPPSSLNFGLLHTAEGYEATGAGELVKDNTYNVVGNVDFDSVAQYLFGIPYNQLTPEQKAVVDKW